MIILKIVGIIMFRSRQNQEVVVVAIDLNRQDPSFEQYDFLPPDKQLEMLAEKIQFICASLQREHNGASWIIAWREYGITGNQTRTVTNDFKKKFKETLLTFVSQHPNLTIIAGTIATEKAGTRLKVPKIQKSYSDLADIRSYEESTSTQATNGWQIDLHEQALTKLIGTLNEDVKFNVIRNTCFVFTRKNTQECEDVAVVIKHHKSAPSNEIDNLDDDVQKIFYPGSDHTRTTLVDLPGDIKVATEICREHDLGLARRDMRKFNVSVADVLIHFVLSDSVKFQPQNAMGEFLIQLDSMSKPRLLVMREGAGKSANVSLYQINGLSLDNTMIGPLKPVVLFSRRIAEEFHTVINQTKDENKKAQLIKIRDEFIKSSDSFISSPMYECLEKMLNDKNVQEILFSEKKQSWLNLFSFGKDAHQEPDFKRWVRHILALVEDEKSINPTYQEYAAKTDSGVRK